MGGWLWEGSGRVGWCDMCVVSLDYLCSWPVQVYVYCARRIPAHLRYNQSSILLHLIPLSVADIANQDLLECGCRTWISCCLPSDTYGRNGATPIFRSFHRSSSSTTGGWSR